MSQVQLFSSPACQSQLYAIDVKAISELAKDALELPPKQRMTLARILLELSEDDQEFSPQVEAAWEDEICRRMKADARLKMLPVIMLTTTDDAREVQRCHQLGCNGYIQKPVDFEKFAEAIRRIGLFVPLLIVPQVGAR